MTCTCGRWKDEQGNNLYDTFIPEVERPAIAQDADVPEPQPGEKRKRQPRRPTHKGALFHKYDRDLHEWVTHLRRVHASNPPVNINGKSVKGSDPLAAKGEGLYYIHSKTAYYNDFFFDYWNECFSKTFRLVCPFYEFTSVKDLEDLLAAKVQRYTMLFKFIVYYESIITCYYVLLRITTYYIIVTRKY